MLVAGMVSVKDFPLAPLMLRNLSNFCQQLVIRFDAAEREYPDLWTKCMESIPNSTKVHVFHSYTRWNRWNWREELLQTMNDFEPDCVLTPDSDERFPWGFDETIEDFMNSKANYMLFKASMVTQTPRSVPLYPGGPHCKMFKWEPGMTYTDYRGFARPWFGNHKPGNIYEPMGEILHYCFWTPEMEQNKVLHR